MDGRVLVIADSDEEFQAGLGKALADTYHVIHCINGKQALEAVLAQKPEILVLDFVLTELDGISLLYRIRGAGVCPMVLAVTQFFSDYVQTTAQELGVGYIMRKPCNAEDVSQRVRDLTTRLKPSLGKPFDATAYVMEQAAALQFSPHHQGTKYLQEAVLVMAKEPGISLTKELYPCLGRHFASTPQQVEHSIRTAITAAYKSGGGKLWDGLFPPNPTTGIPRISNGVVIAKLAEILRLKQRGEGQYSSPNA